jgi:energy-coupling factor transporter ATP-binding protein EcfA2
VKTALETEAAIDLAGAAPEPAPDAITLENVTFTYRSADRPALAEVRLSQRAGEMIGIMGASGAGKSSLVKCLNAIIPGFEHGKFHGLVQIHGRAVNVANVGRMAPLVGMVFQDFEAQLFSTNVAHEVAFAMEQIGLPPDEIRKRLEPALAAVGLAGFEDRDPTSLSGGEKQRLAIASVLALRPSVIVLDEPTTDLDPEGRAEVFALIRRLRELGTSLIVVEHETEEMRECDRIVVLRDAKILTDQPPDQVLSDSALLAASGIRPPGLNQALSALGIDSHPRNVDEAEALIRRSLPLLSAVEPDNSPSSRAPDPTLSSNGARPALVEVENVTHIYGGSVRALDQVSLTIDEGDFVAIIGQNGSGKTTLAKHIVGLLKPADGRVMIAGRERASMRPVEAASLVGYVFQNPDHQIFAGTVGEEVAFGPRNFGLPPDEIQRRCDRVLNAVGLDSMRDKDPFLLGRGERQRLAVASILVLEPKLLILDEPTTGLDYPQQRRMMELITGLNRAGTAIVIITHTPWLVAEYARRAVLMRKGHKLFDGSVRDLFAQEALLSSAAFRLPEVTQLARRFGISALTAEELAAALRGNR